jgi:tRNA-Thr(GGU) m(6)t(6)A37 methyltransferase TsaA
MVLREVGRVRNEVKKPILVAGEDGIELQEDLDAVKRRVHRTECDISEIIIEEEMIDILHGIEDYSHLVVLYWAHLVPEPSRSLTHVHPMGRADFPLMGIFSTCSPARPNPVLMTIVRLHEKKENVLRVSGLDAVDGSPVIDIKPFVGDFYTRQDVRIPGWMQRIIDEMRGKRDNEQEHRHEAAHGAGGHRRGGSSFNMHDPKLVFEELKLVEGDVFLDLGCGPGEYAMYAAGCVGESGVVYALDRVDSHIASLKRRAGEEGVRHMQAATVDITGPLPVDDDCVDVCLLATVLHIPDITRRAKELCTEIRRVLKPNGRLAVIECHKKARPFGPPEHIRLFPAEVKELMSQSGFTVLGEVDLGFNYMIQFGVE